MVNVPNENDTSAVPGAAYGGQTQEQIVSRANVVVPLNGADSMKTLASKIISASEWHFSALTDVNRQPKYAIDPTVSYYGNGSLSLISRLGKLIFSKNINEANNGAFKLDQEASEMYSSGHTTTLGSLDISTLDGYELNQLSPVFPSTSFTPTKPWVKRLFPTLSSNNLIKVAILEAISALLLTYLSSNKDSISRVDTIDAIDMGTIIIDNQEIEDRIFGNGG